METEAYTIHRRARMVLHQLAPADRDNILNTMARVVAEPVTAWPAQRLAGDEPLYLLRADNGWRLMVNVTEGQPPEVVYVVQQGMLDAIAADANRSAGR